jgi:endonuclease-3
MNPRSRREMFARFARQRPEPTTELEYASPFELLVAVVLSAQATDAGVNKATRQLFARADTPQAILDLGLDELTEAIRSIGLYRTKAKNVHALSRQLVEKHGGKVPADRESLEALPGVGRKTANVVLNTVFRQPTMAVDTHIFRVANRSGLARGKTVRAVEEKLLKVIPKEYLLDAHHWLILHGRYVCKARRPDCGACIVCDLCDYRHKTEECSPELIARYATGPAET